MRYSAPGFRNYAYTTRIWLSSQHLRELPAVQCSSSQSLAMCPSVNANKKNLCPEKEGDPKQNEFQAFLKFFVRPHHLEGSGSSSSLDLL